MVSSCRLPSSRQRGLRLAGAMMAPGMMSCCQAVSTDLEIDRLEAFPNRVVWWGVVGEAGGDVASISSKNVSILCHMVYIRTLRRRIDEDWHFECSYFG
jgi:hypothetical protein